MNSFSTKVLAIHAVLRGRQGELFDLLARAGSRPISLEALSAIMELSPQNSFQHLRNTVLVLNRKLDTLGAHVSCMNKQLLLEISDDSFGLPKRNLSEHQISLLYQGQRYDRRSTQKLFSTLVS